MAVINQQYVLLELESAEPIIKEAARDIIRKEYFEPAVASLRHDFENHKVTQEIDAGRENGNSAGNPSGTLPVGSSPKNLYTFIGFPKGTNPTNAIRNRLKSTSAAGPEMLDLPVKRRRFLYEFEIRGPDLDQIYEETPLPWAARLSWAQKIEEGIAGLGRYIAIDGLGRSQGGVQAKNDIKPARQSKSTGVPYLSEIVDKFISRLNR